MPQPAGQPAFHPGRRGPGQRSWARPNMPCASRPIRRAGRARHRASIDLANAINATNIDQASGTLNGTTKTTIIHTDGQLNNAEALPQPDHRLPQRRAGAAGRCRQRDGQRRECPLGRLVQRQARRDPGDQAPARLQHHGGGGQYQGHPAAASRPAARRASRWRCFTTAARPSAPRSTMCR